MYELLKYSEINADNEVELTFTQVNDDGDEVVLDLSFVDRVAVTVYGGNAGVDEVFNSDADIYVSWNSQGRVAFRPSAGTLSQGDFYVGVKVFDIIHPNGQALISRYGAYRFKLRVV